MTNVQRSRRQVRLSRALGIALTPKAQRIFEKRPYAPGEHGRDRRRTESDYAVRMREKQRLRAQYGISEKQLRAAYEKATRTAGQTGNAMLTDLETRLETWFCVPASPAPPPRPVSSWCTVTSSLTATWWTVRPTASSPARPSR